MTTYEIRVRGVVTRELLVTAIGSASQAGHETVLRACLDGQTALYDVLDRLYGLGLQLVDLRAVGPDEVPGARSGVGGT